MNPEIISAVSSAVTAAITLLTALIVIRQVSEMKRTTHVTAFKTVYAMLQTDDCRADRGFVMSELASRPFAEWTLDERKRAERVCQNYDCVGIMCRHEFIPVEVVADSWGDSLRRTWKILSPLVSHYRVERNSKEFWDDFEWLASQAEQFHKRVHG